VIRYRCPVCNKALVAQDEEAGSKLHCPHCGQRLQIPEPPPNKTVLGKIDEAANKTVLGKSEPPVLEVVDNPPPRRRRPRRDYEDDEDDDRDRRPRRRRRRTHPPCPRCGCTDYPRQTTRFGGASIALVIIGIFFWPLIIVAFFVQEKWDVCAECGERLEQTGTGF
jgi:DNA-directed RNA polymerase subunit RPC12/RpoP